MERICEGAFNGILAQARKLTAESAALLTVINRNDGGTSTHGSQICQCPVCREQYDKALEVYARRFDFVVADMN